MDELEREFHAAVMDIYRRGHVEGVLNGTRFLQMVTEHGGLQAARILLQSKRVSHGYATLCERRRLDLTVEAVIFDNPRFRPLFSEAEFEIARKRLDDYGYPAAVAAR